jgi:hypothetical protein
MALATASPASPSSSVVDNFSGSPLSRNEGSLRSDAEDRPVKKSRIEVDGKENHPQPSKKIKRGADESSSPTAPRRKKTKESSPSNRPTSSFGFGATSAAAAAAKNDNAPKSPSTETKKTKKKTEADDDEDWVPPVDNDLSDDELSNGSGRIDASERIKIEDDSSLSDDELSDDDALSETEGEFRIYVQDTVVGLPTTIDVHHPKRPKWSRLKNLTRKVANATKSLALSILPKSLFYNEENENDDDDQSTDSLNYYVKHSCPGSGLDETTLSEMRERPAVTLRRSEQLGAQLGLFKDGRPMRVTTLPPLDTGNN